MKIALLSSTIDVTNGYGNITYEYCKSLKKKGIDFTLFLPKNETELAKTFDFHESIRCVLPKYIFRVKPWNVIGYLKDIDLKSFNLLHSLFDFPYCFMGVRLAKKYNLPYLMGVQGTYGITPLSFWPEKYLMKWAYRRAKKVLVPSQFTKDKIKEYSGEEYPIEIIHNGVNFERFQKEVDLSDLQNKYKDKKILITVGGLRNRKGQDLVIKALSKIKNKHKDIKYILIGKGYWREGLSRLAQEQGVDEMVEFAGNQSGDDLIRYFRRADLFVLTPKVISDMVFEGFGIVYLEASACRKPIVATDAGGVRDAIVDGESGLIVPDGDVEAVAEAIDRLLSSFELSKRMGEAGYQYAKEHDWDIITDKFVDLYKEYS